MAARRPRQAQSAQIMRSPTCLATAPDRIWMFETGGIEPFSTERADWTLSLVVQYRVVQVWHVTGITITLLER